MSNSATPSMRVSPAPAIARRAAGRCSSTNSLSPRGASRVHETGEGEAWLATAAAGEGLRPTPSARSRRSATGTRTRPRDRRARRKGRAARSGGACRAGPDEAAAPPTTRCATAGLLDGRRTRSARRCSPAPCTRRSRPRGARACTRRPRTPRRRGRITCCAASRARTRGWSTTLRRAAEQAAGRRPAGGRGRVAAPGRPRGRPTSRPSCCSSWPARSGGSPTARRSGGWRRRSSTGRPASGSRDRSHARCSRTAATQDALALADADPAELHAGARLLPGAGPTSRRDSRPRRTRRPCWRAGRSKSSARPAAPTNAVALARAALADGALDPEAPAYFLGLRDARLVGPPCARRRALGARAGPRAALRLGRGARARTGRAGGRLAARGRRRRAPSCTRQPRSARAAARRWRSRRALCSCSR